MNRNQTLGMEIEQMCTGRLFVKRSKRIEMPLRSITAARCKHLGIRR